jgi:transcriptional regulator with XRE-family HTH domain
VVARLHGLSVAVRQCVQDLRRDREWTQEKLGDEIGVTQSAVSYLLSGGRRQQQLDLWAEIAHAFEMPLSVLIAQAEERLRLEQAPSPQPVEQAAPASTPDQSAPQPTPEGRPDDNYDQLADDIAARVLRGLQYVMQPDRGEISEVSDRSARVRRRVRRGRRKSA